VWWVRGTAHLQEPRFKLVVLHDPITSLSRLHRVHLLEALVEGWDFVTQKFAKLWVKGLKLIAMIVMINANKKQSEQAWESVWVSG